MTQLQMIQKTKSLALNDQNISAVFMYGSFTKNEGDLYSDIEFYIFLKNKTGFLSEKWVNQIHPLSLYFKNEYGSEVAIFENMVRGEFHFLPTEEMKIIQSWEGMVAFSDFDQMNLVDKEGLLTQTLHQIQIKTPDRTADANTLWLSQSLLNVLLTTGNLIKREDFAHAHHSLGNVQKYLLWLIRANTQKTQHWESPTKSLEKDLDPVWYAAYAATTSDLLPDNLQMAFENALKLTQKLFDQGNINPQLTKILRRIIHQFSN